LCKDQGAVLDFLNVAARPLTSKLKKQRTGRQSEIVTNYAELKTKFQGSPWAGFFED
jgi:hypothetical protein